MQIVTKRVYEDYDSDGGKRILVDRLWPRGISKEKLKIDLWLKEIAPSNELRKWFNHESEKWDKFKELYFKELNGNEVLVEQLLDLAKNERLIFLYSAKDEIHNQAVAFKEYLFNR